MHAWPNTDDDAIKPEPRTPVVEFRVAITVSGPDWSKGVPAVPTLADDGPDVAALATGRMTSPAWASLKAWMGQHNERGARSNRD